MRKIAVIGDGGWGTALALLLYSNALDPVLWSVSPDYAEHLASERENTKFLKGVSIPEGLRITADDDILRGVDVALFVVPSEYLRSVAERFSGHAFPMIVSATKGIENGSLKRPSEILKEYFTDSSISVLSGPSISMEVANNMPTTVVMASRDNSGKSLQQLFMSDYFRVYTSADMTGVELGGALKNVVAIAAGISDGLGYGTNSKAALLTRGLAEITRLGVKLGAERGTFSGLSGIGDLATTCISTQSRNRWFGEQVAKGKRVDEILSETEMVVEGMATCRSAYDLAKKNGIEMPITQKVYEVIYEGKDPRAAVMELMTREAKDEDNN